MTKDELIGIIQDCSNDVTFEYNGKRAGITSEVYEYKAVYQVWYGMDTKEYISIEKLMNDPFYGGKSLNELVDIVEFFFP